jgi:hypothetical protein
MLKPNAAMFMGVFCIDDMQASGTLGNRWTFVNRSGEAFIESVKYPEAAVAYTREYLTRIRGFRATKGLCLKSFLR